MQAPTSFDSDTFNWHPAKYAHTSWWPELSALLPDTIRSEPRFKARLSRALICQHRLREHFYHAVTDGHWCFWDVDSVNTLAFELGIGVYARKYCAALDRRTVLSIIGLLGVSGRERALHYGSRFPVLAAYGATIATTPMTRRSIVDAGGNLMTELVRLHFDLPTDTGCADRFRMRFTRCDEVREHADPVTVDEAGRLIEQVVQIIRTPEQAS